MRVLVTGASGFIGRALAAALARDGHEVVPAARRPPPHGVAVDFAQVPDAAWWAPRLAGIDAVVNAVGILRESPAQPFDALHDRAPRALFEACVQARVRCVVQVSALGADEHAESAYHRSKKAADDALRAMPLRGAVVQPSLVYGPGGTSARLFDTLAASPVLALPDGGHAPLQPVHIDDVIDGVRTLLRDPPMHVDTIAFVGPEPIAFRDYLCRLRAALGFRRDAWILDVPGRWFIAFARAAGRWPGSLLDLDTARMLLRGQSADATRFSRLLGREPRSVDRFVEASARTAARQAASLGVWLPVLRVAIALLWIWTGIVSLGLYPKADSLALLARVGLGGAMASLALYGAAALDLALGVLTLALPAARRRPLWAAQGVVIAGYTFLVTLFLPEYWLHPYGPISKNLPVLAAIALLASQDAARGRGD